MFGSFTAASAFMISRYSAHHEAFCIRSYGRVKRLIEEDDSPWFVKREP